MKIKAAAYTTKGRVRQINQDCYSINGKISKKNARQQGDKLPMFSGRSLKFGVFDGMGGESDGEIAAQMAAKQLKKYDCALSNFKTDIEAYTRDINEKVCRECEKDSKRMGTTFVILSVDDGKAICANIGDSKCFLIRNGKATQLSKDHNRAGQMVDSGIITKLEAKNHFAKNQLTQHIGIFPEEMILEPYFSEEVELCKNDIFLLCSDGFTDGIDEENFADILKNSKRPLAIVKMAVNEAMKKSKDNITVTTIFVV